MLLALAICLTGAKQPADVAAFFPLAAGTKWTYMRDANGSRGELVLSIGQTKRVGKENATEVRAQIPNAVSTYYVVRDNSVFLVAYDPENPLMPAREVFRVAATPQKWSWEGVEHTLFIHMDAETTPIGTRKVLGQDREVVQLKMVAQMSAADSKWTETQTALYAKGVGMYEMVDESVGQSKSKVTLTLSAFEPGRSTKS